MKTKEERKEYNKKYYNSEGQKEKRKIQYEKNKQKILERAKKNRLENPEIFAERHRREYEKVKNDPEYKEYQKKYRETHLEEKREWQKEHRKIPAVKILAYARTRLNAVLKGISKCAHTIELLGCSIDEFKKHLESKFDSKMNWENYGSYWHVDHIVPCSKFDFTNPAEQKKCFHYTNTQPLEKIANIKKGNKII